MRDMHKVQIRLEGYDDGETEEERGPIWRDFYLDLSQVIGWYLPNLNEVLGPAIIVFINGDSFYIKQEIDVVAYLRENVFPTQLPHSQ